MHGFAAAIGLPALVLLIAAAAALPRQQRAAFQQVTHALQVLDQTATLDADLAATVSEGRSFLANRAEDISRRFAMLAGRVQSDLGMLHTLTAENAEQQVTLDRLAQLITARVGVLGEVIKRAQVGDDEAAAQIIQSAHGRLLADQVRDAIAGFRAAEWRLLGLRETTARHATQVTIAALVGGAVLAACSAVAVVVLLQDRRRERKLLAKLRASEEALRTLNLSLEAKVGQRTAALAQSEAGFRLIAEHASDMVSRVTQDGVRSYVSPSGEQIFGLPVDQILADGFLPYIHKDDQAAVAAMRARLLSGVHEHQTVTFRIANPKRGEVWVEAGGGMLFDPQTGAPDGYISVLRDVTERNRVEAALRQGQKMEAIGRIAAGMAHDFNNILQSIIGGLELAQEDAPGESRQGFIGVALGAARRGAYLNHHLLSYARRQMLQPRPVALPAFLTDIQGQLERTISPRIKIEIDAAAAMFPAMVDPAQLKSALLNLGVNAADAMPDGGVLTLHAREATSAGLRWAAITVADTGCGIEAETLPKVFEPFFTTKGLQGAGLGLSMVQGFAAQSGGSVQIRSTPGEGTAVELLLPVPAPVTAAEAPRNSLPPGTGRVLLVDDDPDVLATTGAALDLSGFEVVRAASPAEALALLSAGARFDILVTDYAMPGMNGADLVAQVRATQPALPALLITGFAEVRDVGTGAEQTMVLHKPFRRADIVSALETLLEPARLPQAVSA